MMSFKKIENYQQTLAGFPRISRANRSVQGRGVAVCQVQAPVKAPVKDYGTSSAQGTSRKRNEDRYDVQVNEDSKSVPTVYAAVFDGHGGAATAEWLEKKFFTFISEYWQGGSAAEACVSDAFIQADSKLLQPQGGFFGAMGERGVGGSKCGATAAVALIYSDKKTGQQQLLSANVGDGRVILARGGKAVQLSVDHVPDSEEERIRIEKENPNPRMPLVRYVGGTWRVGGLLALSRAFGDAYLKGSLQFEGIQAGGDGYSSGFGVIARPHVAVTELTGEDSWIIVSSDGLNANVERGGGGGLDNQAAVDMCLKFGNKLSPKDLAKKLVAEAVEAGSTDDITVICLKVN